MSEKIEDLDVYGILGVEQTATVDEVKKAYRKKALTCHPDKNPDNPKAAEEFQQLTRVLEILIDESARAAYDKVINSKKAAKLRHQALDSKRKKFKEDLEARERAAESKFRSSYSEKSDEEKLQIMYNIFTTKIILLFFLMEICLIFLCKCILMKVLFNKSSISVFDDIFFFQYGDVEIVIVSKKKKGSALVEYTQPGPASNAEKYEKGFAENPLRIEMIDKVPERPASFSSQEPIDKSSLNPKSTIINTDFETLVMRQMRQAEERKRLIEQLQKEEEEN
ncbi:dnaJ homolog subfamily C member 17 [Nilaparvata lugens]|uniref:dnaJ homolog subfamily C member 17 n=1 Tax=Nilaparvata lugens TaxID=108931 RepID=UPI00193DBB2E|nr:dnaJ homolog subfamily C member 17 [Nilaparvata lugens]